MITGKFNHFSFEAFIHKDNKASQKLFIKSGFVSIDEEKYIKKASND
jgi:L-amino acid N-acyltransferase YncA